MELVTGKKGTPHITPRMDACFHRGVVGHESGLLRYHGTGVSVASATEVSIGEMELMVQGRYVIIEPNGSDVLAISSTAGTGNKRIDLAVVKIAPNEDGTQSAEWEIVEGDSAATNPVAPTVESGLLDNGEVARYPVIRITVGATAIDGADIVADEIGGGCPILLRRTLSSTTTLAKMDFKIDWSKFKAIEILFHNGSSVKMPCNPDVTEHAASFYSPQDLTATLNFYSRRVGLLKENGEYLIRVWDGVRFTIGPGGAVTTGDANNVCIPREIYGYN